MTDDADLKLARAVERLDDLDEESFDDLLSSLRSDPLLIERLRIQLRMNEMISRVFVPGRRNFKISADSRLSRQQPSGRRTNRAIPSRRSARQSRMFQRGNRSVAVLVLCAAALVAAVLLLAPWDARADSLGTFASARLASIKHGDGRTEQGYAGMPLRRGDEITTTHDVRSMVTVDRSDGTYLAGGGGLHFACPDELRVRLKRGTLHVDVPHSGRASGDRLVIETASGDVHVTGTRFIVTAHPKQTEIRMEQGSVRLTNHLGDLIVSAGERALMSEGSVPSKAPVIDPPIAVIGESTLSVSAANVAPLQDVVVTVANGPGNELDWVGLYKVGADDVDVITWQYLNGSDLLDPLPKASRSASLTFKMPSEPGTYEFRFFPKNLWVGPSMATSRLATSPAVNVGPSP